MALMATQFERILLDVRETLAHVSLHNPPLNVIDLRMMEELGSAFAEIESQPQISVVVLRGEGKCFSAGVDVAAHTPDQVTQMLGKFHAAVRALIATKKVTIAAAHGHSLGGGAELAMICDLVYTTDDAQWGFPEIQLGCFPPVAATALSALVGQKRASELILTGRTISGSEAVAIGLANRAVPQSELERTVNAVTNKLAVLSPAALALTKTAMYAWDSMHFDKGLARAEKIYKEELIKTHDAQEGIQAFLESRAPEWKGH
jgi:cyclohexa-1,5-dienecarbonyl-CoA hydratase